MGKLWCGLSFILVIIKEKESWDHGVELRAIKDPHSLFLLLVDHIYLFLLNVWICG